MHKLLLYESAAYPLPFRKHVPLMLSHTLRTCPGRRTCVYCIHERPPTRTHINSPGTSVFPHNNCEMSVNLQTLLYFYCCSGTLVNAAWSGPACFSVHWPFICLHSPPFLWCISPLMYVWKCVGVRLCLCTNTYVWVSHLCYGTVCTVCLLKQGRGYTVCSHSSRTTHLSSEQGTICFIFLCIAFKQQQPMTVPTWGSAAPQLSQGKSEGPQDHAKDRKKQTICYYISSVLLLCFHNNTLCWAGIQPGPQHAVQAQCSRLKITSL